MRLYHFTYWQIWNKYDAVISDRNADTVFIAVAVNTFLQVFLSYIEIFSNFIPALAAVFVCFNKFHKSNKTFVSVKPCLSFLFTILDARYIYYISNRSVMMSQFFGKDACLRGSRCEIFSNCDPISFYSSITCLQRFFFYNKKPNILLTSCKKRWNVYLCF